MKFFTTLVLASVAALALPLPLPNPNSDGVIGIIKLAQALYSDDFSVLDANLPEKHRVLAKLFIESSPRPVKDFFLSINDADFEEITEVTPITDHKPTFAEMAEKLRTQAPSFYEKIIKLFDDFKVAAEQMSPEEQEYYSNLSARLVKILDTHGNDDENIQQRLIQELVGVLRHIFSDSEEGITARAELVKAFPELDKLFKNPDFQNVAKYLVFLEVLG